MFTGLVQDVAGVIDVISKGDALRLVLVTKVPPSRFEMGASVACNGVCLTVVGIVDVPATGETLLEFDVGPETLQASRLGSLGKGQGVNLEPALRVGDSLGGHDVQGHVDVSVPVRVFEAYGPEFWRLVLEIPAEYGRYLVPKGSITVRGVSLTIAAIERGAVPRWGGAEGTSVDLCAIMLVPHTLAHTNLSKCTAGDVVEVEFDKNVKTIATLLQLMVPHMLPRKS